MEYPDRPGKGAGLGRIKSIRLFLLCLLVGVHFVLWMLKDVASGQNFYRASTEASTMSQEPGDHLATASCRLHD